jgi:hypothetical protein
MRSPQQAAELDKKQFRPCIGNRYQRVWPHEDGGRREWEGDDGGHIQHQDVLLHESGVIGQ